MGELERARLRAAIEESHDLYRRGGLDVFTRWMANTINNTPHPDVARFEAVDASTLVLLTWSGTVATVGVDAAEACSWCRGKGRPVDNGSLWPPQPCEACMGTGLAPGHRGHVAEPVTERLRVLSASR